MTLLVKHKNLVAIDRRMTGNEDDYSEGCKILHRGEDRVITCIGSLKSGDSLCQWILDGCIKDEWPFSKDYTYGYAECDVWYDNRVVIFNTDSPFRLPIPYDEMPQGTYTSGTAAEFAKGWLWRNTESLPETGFTAASNERLLEKLFRVISQNYGHVGYKIDIIKISELKGEKE